MNTVLILLGVFITLESINAARLFNGVQHGITYRVFTSLQHSITGMAGFIFTWDSYLGHADWQHIVFALSITAFILSEAVYRWMFTLKLNHPFYYYWIVGHFNFLSRRQSDYQKEVNNG